jgi:prepilin-type N-terminal cleavage/methylation domain-containing protein
MKRRVNGFTLIELLLVLAIIGIISGIAIPSFLGQRRRARNIGDAQTTAQILRMALETYKADNGTYGAAGTYTWTGTYGGVAATADAAATALLPTFSTGRSQMNISLVVAASGLTYTISMIDPSISPANTVLYETDQTGATLVLLQ